MKVIVGLGNPGKKYQGTRHNLGFMVVDRLAAKWGLKWQTDRKLETLRTLKRTENTEVILVKPQTFMNESGIAVKKVVASCQLPACLPVCRQARPARQVASLYVIHDDLDIPLGVYKIQLAKGPKRHKGLLSVEDHLKTKKFWRARVGIGQAKDSKFEINRDYENYVLERFSKKEREIVEKTIEKLIKDLLTKIYA